MFSVKEGPLQDFSRGDALCSFSAEAAYTVDGYSFVAKPCFLSWENAGGVLFASAQDGGIRLKYEIKSLGLSSLQLRLSAHNNSAGPVRLEKLSPFVIDDGALSLGASNSYEWIFYRQGRHKNDLPSVCCLGRNDESFSDALSSLVETGGMGGDAPDGLTLISDSLTVIKGGPDSDDNLVVTFATGADFMVSCALILNDDSHFYRLEASSVCNIRLDPGMSVSSEWVEVSFVSDVFAKIESFADEKAQLYGARKNKIFKSSPSVYCTWYYYGSTVTERDVIENLEEIKRRGLPFDVFQIDDGWENRFGDWQANEKFPSDMKALADKIRAAGLMPGIWTCPFIASEDSPVFKEHPHWFLFHLDGSPCLFPMNNNVYRVLDLTNPDAVSWAAGIYKNLREWGYMYHKLDFTRAAVIQENCKYYDDSVSITRAYRHAVAAIRENMGDDAYFLMCGGLYDPLIGIVDGQRSGSDTLSMWSIKTGKGGKAAPFTIKQSILRYWMNFWWDNDPDALMVRRQNERTLGLNLTYGLLNEDEAETSALNQYMSAGLVCSTEPLKQIDDDRLHILRRVMPTYKTKPTPRSIFSAERYPSFVDVENEGGKWHTLCFVNWSDTSPMPCEFILNGDALGDFCWKHQYFVVSSYDGSICIDPAIYGQKINLGLIPPHGSMLVKVMPRDLLPAVIGTNGHYSMGSEVDRLEISDRTLIFEVKNLFDYPSLYKIRLPEGFHARSLPKGISARGRDIMVHIPERGEHHLRIPLAKE
ncbi:MAG: glycoside hydrolase family 36 protein [Christensenellales bacterium]|jgi:hypothetical protein